MVPTTFFGIFRAFAGVGRRGLNHAGVLAGPGAPAGVCDPDGGAARFSVPGRGKIGEARWPGVEAAVIAAPTDMHRELAIAAIRAEKHVLRDFAGRNPGTNALHEFGPQALRGRRRAPRVRAMKDGRIR